MVRTFWRPHASTLNALRWQLHQLPRLTSLLRKSRDWWWAWDGFSKYTLDDVCMSWYWRVLWKYYDLLSFHGHRRVLIVELCIPSLCHLWSGGPEVDEYEILLLSITVAGSGSVPSRKSCMDAVPHTRKKEACSSGPRHQTYLWKIGVS